MQSNNFRLLETKELLNVTIILTQCINILLKNTFLPFTPTFFLFPVTNEIYNLAPAFKIKALEILYVL